MILKRSHRDIEKLSPLKEKQFSSNLHEKLINFLMESQKAKSDGKQLLKTSIQIWKQQ